MKNNLIFTILFSFFAVTAFAGKLSQSVYEFYHAVDMKDWDKASNLLADDVKVNIPFSPQSMDKLAYRQIGMSMGTAFPDMMHKVLDVVEGKNSVAFKAWFSGTNTGPMMGNPATGNRVEAPFQGFMKFNKEGKMIEVAISFDVAFFNAQIMKGINPNAIAENLVRELYKVMDAGQTDKFPMYCAADFKISNPFLAEPSPVQAFQGVIQTQKTAFPDMKHEVVEIVSDGKYVTTSGIFSGTNTGSMMGNPPTGNKVNIPFLVLDELDEKGKIRNRTVQFDSKSFESQLMKGINPNAAAEATVRGILAAADAGDGKKLLSYFTADAKHYFGGQLNTNDELAKRVVGFKAGFPDIKRVIDDIYVNNGVVTIRGWLVGTNTGSFMGKPATGNKIKVSVLGLYKLNTEGKVTEAYVELDGKTVEAQLKGNSVGMK